MSGHHMQYLVPVEVRRGHWIPQNCSCGLCEPPCRCWKLSPSPLQEEQALLSTGPPLQSHHVSLLPVSGLRATTGSYTSINVSGRGVNGWEGVSAVFWLHLRRAQRPCRSNIPRSVLWDSPTRAAFLQELFLQLSNLGSDTSFFLPWKFPHSKGSEKRCSREYFV